MSKEPSTRTEAKNIIVGGLLPIQIMTGILGLYLHYDLCQIRNEVELIRESNSKLDYQMGKAIEVIHWEMLEIKKNH